MFAPAFKSTDSTTQTELTQCGKKKRANLESKLHRKLLRGGCEIHLFRITYSQRSRGSFLIPASPMALNVGNTHMGLGAHAHHRFLWRFGAHIFGVYGWFFQARHRVSPCAREDNNSCSGSIHPRLSFPFIIIFFPIPYTITIEREIGGNAQQLVDGWCTSTIIIPQTSPNSPPAFPKTFFRQDNSSTAEEKVALCSYFHFLSLTAITAQA